MGIGSWLKKLRGREDEVAIERAEEARYETREERYATSSDLGTVKADQEASRAVHEPTIEDAEHFVEDDDGP
jgi:hypothetical protein